MTKRKKPDEFEKMHAKLTPAEIERFEASFDDFMKGSHNRSSHSPIDDTPSAATRASTPFEPTINNYRIWVFYTSDFIKSAMNQMKTPDGLLALYNKIQEHYDKIPNQAKIPKPPDEKTTDFPMTDILSDTNYKLISREIGLVSHLSYCLSSLDLMCQALYSSDNDIYNDIYNEYIKILSEWLTMIKNETKKKQQSQPKKQKKGGKSRRRHRKTKRKPYSRRRR